MDKKVSVIIVHWNTPDFLQKQLFVLSKSRELEIIVVDNASSEKISFQHTFPTVIFIENKINRGFAFGCNQGVVKAKGEWLLFLNPDVVIDSSQINSLIEYAQKNNLVACSPQPQSSDYRKPVPSAMSLLAEFTPLNRFIKKMSGQMTLTGGCLLIKTVVFKKLGGFDERFFLWFEDSDLTKRLIDNSYTYGFAPITIKHEGGVTFKKNDKQYNRDIFFNSMDVYAKKHFSSFGQFIVSRIKKRYSTRYVLPKLNDAINITIPNVSRELLAKFLQSNHDFFSKNDEYVVVTSGIGEYDVWDWRQKYPYIRFIPIKKNKGFASTVNIGFRVSTGKYIGTVNDDVVLNKKWMEECLTCCDEKTGSVNPIIYKKNGLIESAGVDVLPHGKAIPKTNYKRGKRSFEIDATNAAAVLYTKDALNKTGLFDERFGSYLEDIDLSLRLKRKGYANIVCTTASVIHAGQSTSSSLGVYKNWLDFKNWNLVIIKNWSLVKMLVNFPQIVLERIRNLSGIIKSL